MPVQITSGADIHQTAKKVIPDKELKRIMKDPTVKEFVRICSLFQLGAMIAPDEIQQFSHFFKVRDPKTNRLVDVTFKVVVTAKRGEY